jgi:CO/xanthine dehydrogenase Mo-binding subunit
MATWEDYPILRFSEVPKVEVHIINSELPSVGAGEAATGPTAAAIANALRDALGVRVRDLPLTPDRIVKAMEQS